MITKIGILNFKAFSEIEIEPKSLCLLAGMNGSGKSSVLQAIAVIRQSWDADCLKGEQGLLLNSDLVELGTGRDVLFERALMPVIGFYLKENRRKYKWEFIYEEKSGLLELKSRVDIPDPLDSFLVRPMQFLRADRITPNMLFPRSYANFSRRKFLGTRGQYAIHYLANHQDDQVDGLRRDERYGPGLLPQVEGWMSHISPGVGVLVGEVAGTDLARLSYVYDGKAGITSSNEYRPTNVGFGLTYALPIVVACLAAEKDDLLLIENPEAHLHPQGQFILGMLLARTASDGAQIVVESHSDHVLNGIRLSVKKEIIAPEKVSLNFFIRNGILGTQVKKPQIRKNGRLSDWPEGFFDEWDKAVMELN